MESMTVIKQNLEGKETYRYEGFLLERTPTRIVLEARFTREDMSFHGIVLGKNDRFIETYYTDRWYNIFEIHDRQDDHLKGWYCNIGYPAEIQAGRVSYIDLALDLLVFPDGNQLVLDVDEFESLSLNEKIRSQALHALKDLKGRFINEPERGRTSFRP